MADDIAINVRVWGARCEVTRRTAITRCQKCGRDVSPCQVARISFMEQFDDLPAERIETTLCYCEGCYAKRRVKWQADPLFACMVVVEHGEGEAQA